MTAPGTRGESGAEGESRVTAAEFEALVREQVPHVGGLGVEVLALGPGTAELRLPFRDDLLRPGGTVTGPALFGLADVALYGAVLSRIGRVELAVSTSMTINFLRRPPPGAVTASARLLKLGRRLAYGEVLLFSGDRTDAAPDAEADGPVAHATGTYSIPPERG